MIPVYPVVLGLGTATLALSGLRLSHWGRHVSRLLRLLVPPSLAAGEAQLRPGPDSGAPTAAAGGGQDAAADASSGAAA